MKKDIFTLASIGLDQADQNILLTLTALAKTRKPAFELYEHGKSGGTADILVVDADNPDAIKRWDTYQNLKAKEKKIPTVMLCQAALADNPEEAIKYVARPLSASVLLSILENMVSSYCGYELPDLFEGSGKIIEGAKKSTDKEGGDTGIKALVVDDSLPVRIQMKKALDSIASVVDFAETGEEAEKLIGSNYYDIVFLDVILPGVDGYDICKLIKKDPEKKNIPVIMLTSNSSPADRIKGKMSGCDTYLIKPVKHEIFREVIYEYLDLDD